MFDPVQTAFARLFGPEFGHGKSFNLAPLRGALAELGSPQAKLAPVIHVAGTNGKGSTIAFIRAIAEAAGLRAHAFTKPHLVQLNERFCVSGNDASDEVLIAAAECIAAVAPQLTQFDAQVAAAFVLFSAAPADLVLLEAGMGGREDSTNVIATPALSILTPIALDHQDVLGATLAEIAVHKAGILKPHRPAIVARQTSEANAVIEAAAQRIGAALFRQGVEWDAFAQAGRLIVQTEKRALDLPLPALAGAHQIDNAGLAVAALLASHVEVSDAAFAAGVAAARWPGRLEPLTRGALAEQARAAGAELWIDGGHNAHAAAALKHALDEMQRRRPARVALIVGLRARKDWRGFIETLAPAAAQLIAAPLGEEGAEPLALAAHTRASGVAAATAPDLGAALAQALGGGAKRVLICGSLLLVAEALRA